MAYTKTVWKNRQVEKPRTYTMTDNGDGTITLDRAPGEVYEAGTAMNADNMNHLEEGMEAAHNNQKNHEDAENPHKGSASLTHASRHRTDGADPLTPEMLGAAPASIISYTISPNAVGELDTLLKGVYNAMGSNSRKFIYTNMLFEDGLSGGIWQITLAKTTNDYGFIIAESYTTNPSPLVQARTIYGGAWGDWYDISASTFAPSGYGLGGSGKLLTSADNLDNITANGWYWWYDSRPTGALYNYCYMRVDSGDKSSKDYVTQTIRRSGGGGTIERYNKSGEWVEEWVNPPMSLGVEYRTTERWQGNPVYTKLVDCGKGIVDGAMNLFPNTGENSVFVDAICKAVNGSGWGYFLDHCLTFGENGSGNCVMSLSAGKDLSAYNIYLTVKYYKV